MSMAEVIHDRSPMVREVDSGYIEQIWDSAERMRDGRDYQKLSLVAAVRRNRITWSPPFTYESIDRITRAVYAAPRRNP